MHVSKKCVDQIASWESFQAKAYLCPTAKKLQSEGKPVFWTIGFGHVIIEPSEDALKTKTLSKQEATDLLTIDIQTFEKYVSNFIGKKRIPTQNQFDAMVSLCYNIGPGNFKKSDVLEGFLDSDDAKALSGFMDYTRSAGVVLKGLVTRRQTEAQWYAS